MRARRRDTRCTLEGLAAPLSLRSLARVPQPVLLLAPVLCFCLPLAGQQGTAFTVPTDVPLRVESTRTIPLRAGQPFEGKLTEPVYGADRLLIPAGVVAHGIVSASPAADRHTRMNARLDGDFTPLREPVVRITELLLPSGAVLPVSAEGSMRNAGTISLAQHPERKSMVARLKQQVREQVQQVRDIRHEPRVHDRLWKMLYAQLPYHPQRVWSGSTFDAVLTNPLAVPPTITTPAMTPARTVDLESGTLHARLTTGISSGTAKKGDAVTAVLTEPFCNAQGQMMLPTGTTLQGQVMQATTARAFARNGRLRFTFRSIAATSSGPLAHIAGDLRSIDALSGQNVALDAEGGARAQPDKGRFLEPLVLGALAVASQHQDQDGGDRPDTSRSLAASNGFGLPARVLAAGLASRNLSTGFATFALTKSVYRHYIARGHEVTFPRHTELTIALGRR